MKTLISMLNVLDGINEMEQYSKSHIKFIQASSNEIHQTIKTFHYTHEFPNRATHCFAVMDQEEVIAALAAGPTEIPEVVEFISHARNPKCQVQMSSFISYCVGQLSALRKWKIAVSFGEKGNGTIYRACSWNYDGKRKFINLSPPEEGRFYLFWKPLLRGHAVLEFAKSIGLRNGN